MDNIISPWLFVLLSAYLGCQDAVDPALILKATEILSVQSM